ncbi:sensor histidine kinase [Deinococcus oregonensis]|uniref:Sensor histidine kinase n=1 Tax=Deinococcus oregonensis TaxID=1805970 RepID=A0ABV6B978_9DEIO
MKRPGQTRIRVVSLVAWLSLLLVAHTDVINTHHRVEDLAGWQRALWAAAFTVFGMALWQCTHPALSLRTRRHWGLLLSGCACVAILLFPQGGNMVGLMITAAGAVAAVMTLRRTLALIFLQSLCLIGALSGELGWAGGAFLTFNFLMFQMFMAGLVFISNREFLSRQALAESHLQLRFTQALLEETARTAERARISRELHDGLGHHLTILGLDLELAAHVPHAEERLAAVQRARALNRQLMGVVRESIDALRVYDWEDVQRVQAAVCASNPDLHVEVRVPEVGQALPQAVTHACLRLFQESVTNTIKYAQARHFWYHVLVQGQELTVLAWDDGAARLPLTVGRGLDGLGARIRALGGTFQTTLTPGGAVHLRASLPLDMAGHP